MRVEQPRLVFPERLLLSDNFFRPRWVGLGDRRLKNVCIVLEWIPEAWKESLRRRIAAMFKQLTLGCGNRECTNSPQYCCASGAAAPMAPNAAAARAMELALATIPTGDLAPFCRNIDDEARADESATPARFLVAISLAEGETLSRVIHTRQAVLGKAGIALRTINGHVLDRSPLYYAEPATAAAAASRPPPLVPTGMQCLRFFNCEMYYTDPELLVLEHALARSSINDRLAFFLECLRLRRRERNLWGDTPLAKLFTPQEEWHLLRGRAKVEQVSDAIAKAIRERKVDPILAFVRVDADADGSITYDELQRALEWMRLGFAPRDYYEVARLADQTNKGYEEHHEIVRRRERRPIN